MFVKFSYFPEEIKIVNFKIIFGVQIISEYGLNCSVMFKENSF